MNLPPIIEGPYTDEQRQVIASYLLHMRAGTLSALSSSRRKQQLDLVFQGEKETIYYAGAEAYSRFLLYWIGYQVTKDAMYSG